MAIAMDAETTTQLAGAAKQLRDSRATADECVSG